MPGDPRDERKTYAPPTRKPFPTPQNSWKSAWAACQGVWLSWSLGRNMRIHLLAATLVLGLAIQAELPNGVRALLVLTVVTVVALETMNTALERAVNLVTVEYHPLAKQAKDLAAAAVLLAALGSLGVAWFVWVEHRQALLAVLMTLQNPHWVQWVWIALMLAQITAIIRWREPH